MGLELYSQSVFNSATMWDQCGPYEPQKDIKAPDTTNISVSQESNLRNDESGREKETEAENITVETAKGEPEGQDGVYGTRRPTVQFGYGRERYRNSQEFDDFQSRLRKCAKFDPKIKFGAKTKLAGGGGYENHLELKELKEIAEKKNVDVKNWSYRPLVYLAEEIKPKKVFKREIDIVLPSRSNEIKLIATDDPSIIFGEKGKLINKFIKSHDWEGCNKSLVAFFISPISATYERETKCFILWLPTFVHFTSLPLKLILDKISLDLSDSWNRSNSSSAQVDLRSSNERAVKIDCSLVANKKTSPTWSHLEFAGTSYNHNMKVEHDPRKIICSPEKIYWQLRYKLSNKNKPEPGMFTLSQTDWKDLLEDEKFVKFVQEIREFCPLTEQYSDRIASHFGWEQKAAPSSDSDSTYMEDKTINLDSLPINVEQVTPTT